MASNKNTVMRITLTGDSAPAVAALKKLSAQLAATEGDFKSTADAIYKEAERIEQKLERQAQAPRGGGAGDANGSRLQTGATDRISNLADSAGLGEFSDDIAGAVTKLGGLGTSLAAVTVVAAGLGKAMYEIGQFSINSLTDVGPQVEKLAGTMRISSEEATKFWYAISAKGVDTTQAIDGLVQMQTNLNAAPEKFRAMGIEQARFADGSADLQGTLMNVAAAWREGDAAQRAAIGSVALGEEAYRELMPMLAMTAEEFEALKNSAGNVLSAEDTARAAQYNEAIASAAAQVKLLGAQIGAELAPYVVVLAEALNTVAANAAKVADVLGPAVGVGVEILKAGLESIPGAGNLAGRAAVFVGEQWESGASRVRAAATVIGEARARLNEGMAGFAGALVPEAEQKRIAGLQNELVGSYQAISDAKRTVQEAARNTDDVEAAAAASIEQANEQAAQTIANAAANVESARQSQADAVADLQQAEVDAGRTIADAAKSAAKQVASAEKQLADARKRQAEAAEDLADTEREAQESVVEAAEDASDRIADAQDRVTDARERAAQQARDNARSLVDAEDRVRQAINDSLTNDNTIEARDDIARAVLELGRTKEDVADSEKDTAKSLAEAEAGLRDAHVEASERRAEAEEQAEERINQARERLTGAIEGVTGAEAGLRDAIVTGEDAKARAAEGAASRVETARSRVTAASLAVDTAETTFKTQFDVAQKARAKATEDAADRVEDARDREKEAATKLLLHELEVSRIRRLIKNPTFVDRMSMSESNWVAESDTAAGNSDLVAAYEAAGALPRFHSGGVYRAPTPGGEGLAILQDGEQVLTKAQSAGGVTIVVQGSVISERELTEIIAKAVRRGY